MNNLIYNCLIFQSENLCTLIRNLDMQINILPMTPSYVRNIGRSDLQDDSSITSLVHKIDSLSQYLESRITLASLVRHLETCQLQVRVGGVVTLGMGIFVVFTNIILTYVAIVYQSRPPAM